MTIFEDGFESGNFSAWTNTSGSPTVQSSTSHHGSYSARVPLNSRVYKVFTDKDIAYARVYVKWASNPSSGNQAYLFNLGAGDGAGTLVYVRIENDSGTLKYGLRTKNDSGVFVDDFCESGPTPTSTVWHCIELKWQKNTPYGAKLIVDGSYAGCTTATTYDNQADTLNLQLEQTEITAYYDCAVVADVYIEPEEGNLNVNNNLTVGNKITMKTPESGYWIDAQTVMIGGDPIFHIDQGVMGVKDISCNGYLGANSPTKLQFGATYTDCDRFDIGKPVAVGGTPIPQTVLADYDNESKRWWLSRPTTISDGSAMTIVGGTGAGTTSGDSDATGGGAIMLGQGFEREDDPPRINLVDNGDHILYITSGSSVDVGADAILANMKLKDLTATQIKVKSTNNVFAVTAGDNGLNQDTYLIPQNPSSGGLGLGTANFPFKWVDASSVFTDNLTPLSGGDITVNDDVTVNGYVTIKGTSESPDANIILNAGYGNATICNADILFQEYDTTKMSCGYRIDDDQFYVYDNVGSKTLLTLNHNGQLELPVTDGGINTSGDIIIDKASATLNLYAQSGDAKISFADTATYKMALAYSAADDYLYLQDVVGSKDLFQVNHDGQLKLPVQGSSGGLVIGEDANLYRGGQNHLQTDSYFTIAGSDEDISLYLPNGGIDLDGDIHLDGGIYPDGGISLGAVDIYEADPGILGIDGDLTTSGDINLSGSIQFSEDTNLYRSDANILKTDDALYVVGDISTDGTVDGVDIAGSIDQAVKTTSSPSFATLTLTDYLLKVKSFWMADFQGYYAQYTKNLYYDEEWKYINDGPALAFDLGEWNTASDFVFKTAPLNSSGADAAATVTERMRLTEGGLLKIPTTGESAGLWLGGNCHLYEYSTGILRTPNPIQIANTGFACGASLTFNLVESSEYYTDLLKNLYYDSEWKYIGNGPALILRLGTWNTSSDMTISTASVNSGGAGVSATVTDRFKFTEGGQLQLLRTGSDGALVLGGDANLYRSAQDELKTDDIFQATGFKSSDGTSGDTDDVVISGTTLHFKNGLFVGID